MSGKSTKTLGERFWAKVNRAGDDDCWLWTGSTSRFGYGRINMPAFRKVYLAHRVSWFLKHGVWPDLDVLHRCDVPACVNPAHLFVGTHAANMADMASKLRTGRRRLTPIEIRRIRIKYDEGATQVELAARYGVRQCHISDIVRRKYWKHVTCYLDA